MHTQPFCHAGSTQCRKSQLYGYTFAITEAVLSILCCECLCLKLYSCMNKGNDHKSNGEQGRDGLCAVDHPWGEKNVMSKRQICIYGIDRYPPVDRYTVIIQLSQVAPGPVLGSRTAVPSYHTEPISLPASPSNVGLHLKVPAGQNKESYL